MSTRALVPRSSAAPAVRTLAPGGAADKHAAVQAMFGRIARRYDLMNAVMTLGMDRLWRRRTAEAAAVAPGGLVLDVGTGTGDLALDLARLEPGARVVGLDYTAPMLARAPAKAAAGGLAEQVAWVRGDGQRLPFPDDTFDAVTSAFVLRNFADLYSAYADMARVTRPGGRVVALELSPDSLAGWRQLFALYFERLVPHVGALVAGDRTAYTYLPASVAAFLGPDALAGVMRDAGLVPLPPRRMMLGSLVIHVGFKPSVASRV